MGDEANDRSQKLANLFRTQADTHEGAKLILFAAAQSSLRSIAYVNQLDNVLDPVAAKMDRETLSVLRTTLALLVFCRDVDLKVPFTEKTIGFEISLGQGEGSIGGTETSRVELRIRSRFGSIAVTSEITDNSTSHNTKFAVGIDENDTVEESEVGFILHSISTDGHLREVDFFIENAYLTDAEKIASGPSFQDFFFPSFGLASSKFSHEGNYFWQRWLKGFRQGSPINWDIQREILKIPDEFWETSLAKLENRIAIIEAEFLLEQYPIAEDVMYNDETARFGRTPRPISHPVRHEAVLIGIRDAIDDALAGNFLTSETYDIKRLDKMLEKDSKHPHVIEQKLMQVFKSLEGQMSKGVLPDAPEVEGLSAACAEGGLEMRSLYPEIAKARAERAAQSLKEATKDELATLDATKATIEKITEDEFGDEINRDIDEITETHNRAAAGKGEVSVDAVSRTGNRIAKIWLLTKKIAKGTALGGGAIIVGAEGIAAINEALPILLRLLGL